MKGVILAGGQGTRLRPLTKITNKHLLPVYHKPMIYYPLATLVAAGITDVLVISGRGHAGDFLELLESGRQFGATLSYAVQEEAGGIAQALSLAEDFADGGKLVVVLGDNVFEDDITDAVRRFDAQEKGARVFVKAMENPRSYGVAEVSKGKILGIEEKPQEPKSNFAVVGLYMYDGAVFDIIKNLEPSARGELEITDVNNAYIEQGTMYYEELEGWWGDCGESFESWLRATLLAAQKEGVDINRLLRS